MRPLRPLIAGLFALVLVLGGLLVPVMRAEEAGAFRITLCAADGLTAEVATDAQGRPLGDGTRHHCPDCTLAGLALAPTGAHLAPFQAVPRRVDALLPDGTLAGQSCPAFRARGPPVLA